MFKNGDARKIRERKFLQGFCKIRWKINTNLKHPWQEESAFSVGYIAVIEYEQLRHLYSQRFF